MAKVTATQVGQRAALILERLSREYPDASCTLDFEQPLQLLISTILAAQCTDERVNIVTKDLFRKYRSARDFAQAPDEELQSMVKSCGFFRQKTKSIKKTCKAILEQFDGKVPDNMDDLLKLDGVGRKTANVLLGECFDTPGIIVDTHCKRLANRLAFTTHDDPAKIEQDLMKLIPREHWTRFSHCLVYHGRNTCLARAPRCPQCVIADLCPFPHEPKGRIAAT